MTASHITQAATVFVPVADQDRAAAFWVERLGWTQTGDFPYGDGLRWVEVAPEGSTNRLALVPPGEGRSPGGDVVRCALTSTDAAADRAAMAAAGVDVDDHVAGEGSTRGGLVDQQVRVPDPVPPQFCFRDLDGNRFLVVQPPPADDD